MPEYDEQRLRELLDDTVADVDPPPALQAIQSRTRQRQKVTPMSGSRPWIYAALGAVAATAATLVAVTVLSDDDGSRTTSGPAASPDPSTAPAEDTPSSEPSATPDPSDDPSGSAEQTVAVPVYYVADTPAGPRLFREFHRMTTSSVAKSALVEASTDSAADPDYYSPWAGIGGAVGLVDRVDDRIVVDLGGPVHDRPASLSPEQAAIAVEQLVYTVQAAYQQRSPVQFLLDGHPTDTVLGVPTSEPLAAGDPMQVQGTVWVTSPQDGDRVAPTFEVQGRGAFFEANVSWQLLKGDEVVRHGFATAEEGNTLSPYAFTVKGVPAGDYVLRVYDADMSGGEGNGEAEDTKRITVTG